MIRVSVTEFRNSMSKFIESVEKDNEIIILTRHGQDVAAVLSPDLAVRLHQLKFLRDNIPADCPLAKIYRAQDLGERRGSPSVTDLMGLHAPEDLLNRLTTEPCCPAKEKP